MHVVITGGAGFIGSHVCDCLLRAGHAVTVIDNLSNGRRSNVPAAAAFLQLDIRDPETHAAIVRIRPDAIIHHAAQISVGRSVTDPSTDMEINTGGTLRLLEAAVAAGTRKFIFASTGGAIYGEQRYFPADEHHPLAPISPYGISKMAAEQYLHCFQRLHGISGTVLRYSNVYGPRQDPTGEAGVIAIFCQCLLTGTPPRINGDGNQTRDFVYVEDVARANLCALHADVQGTFNISTASETSINELLGHLQQIVAADTAHAHGPALPGELIRSCLAWDRARHQLDWEPVTPLADGLSHTVNFFHTPQIKT